MAQVVRILDRNRWVYLNVEQVVRVYHHAAEGLWTVDTTEGGPGAQHFLSDDDAGRVLAAMGWTEPTQVM